MPTEPDLQRPSIRAALALADHLAAVRLTPPLLKLPQSTWQELHRTLRLLEWAASRRWGAASQQLLDDLGCSLSQLESELRTVRRELTEHLIPKQISSPGDILADLTALAAEFDDLQIDLEERTISVVTDAIELAGTDLGRFRIELEWPLIGRQRAYRVRAVDPQAAAGSSEVPHPHVRNDDLCEGEGARPIAAALAEGRLLEFFVLVRQVLQNYNPDSAFVPLDRWDGVNCRDCGERMPGDEAGQCERCEAPVCSGCWVGCDRCHAYACTSCTTECAACESYFCTGCLTNESGRLLCDRCLEETRAAEASDAESVPTPSCETSDFPEDDHAPDEDDIHADTTTAEDDANKDLLELVLPSAVGKDDARPPPGGEGAAANGPISLAPVHSLRLVQTAVPA